MHTAVVLFGFTAILGKLITLQEIALVWNRLWIAVIGLLLIPGALRGFRGMSRKMILRFVLIGVLVALHWITFYGSIKIGNNASITLACFATTSLFTSILEPWLTKKPFKLLEILIGIMVIIGIVLLSGVGEAYYKAIIVGLISAFIAALFSVLNKKWISNHNSISVSILELSSGFIFISLCFPFIQHFFPQSAWIPNQQDWLWLIILGILCTSFAYVLVLNSLKELSAYTANLSINLEPVYGILLAIFLLGEAQELNLSFYIGTSIILLGVILHPILLRIQKKKRKQGIPE